MPIQNIQKKYVLLLSVMLATLVTLSPFAIDTYLAAMPTMANFFGVSIGMVELTITLYFLGFAIGNFFGGPLSDSFGRRTIALTGIALYGISSLAIASSPKVEMVMVFRVIQAFGGGFATVTANVFIRDWFEGKQVARLITIVSMMMMIAPLIAPVVGAFLLEWHGWQAIFYFLFGFSAVLFILFFALVPESREREKINHRITVDQLLGKYRIFFSDKKSVLMLFAVSFSMSGMFVFITRASYIYIDFFGVPRQQFPLFFGANVLLNVMLSLVNTRLLKKYNPATIMRSGLIMQLFSGMIILFSVWQSQPSLWMVFSGIVLFVGSLGWVFGNGSAVILNINPKVSGSANATIGITRFLLSFIIGSLVSLIQVDNLIPLGLAMFGCSLLGLLFFIWGRKS